MMPAGLRLRVQNASLPGLLAQAELEFHSMIAELQGCDPIRLVSCLLFAVSIKEPGAHNPERGRTKAHELWATLNSTLFLKGKIHRSQGGTEPEFCLEQGDQEGALQLGPS